MRGLFGLFYRDGAPVSKSTIALLSDGMAGWGNRETVFAGCAFLGRADASASREPYCQSLRQPADRVVFMAAGRVDNLEELRCQLSVSGPASSIADADLIYRAYLTWGEDCVNRIYGDWSFAAWHHSERKLFVARDHYGSTSLCYYADEHVFAFASEPRALLALNLVPPAIDELYLAQLIISWTAFHGERTIRKGIHRLPPAHTLTVTPDRLNVHQYWSLESTPVLRLRRREDYVPAFREVFDEAVRSRLRCPLHDGEDLGVNGSVASLLSGGLDSGSVAATAAHLLQPSGKRLTAFTAVPLSDTSIYVGKRFGDEFPFAQANARFAGNVDHVAIAPTCITPIQAMRRLLEIHDQPAPGAGAAYFFYNLLNTIGTLGYRFLLTGACGNASISWTGDVFSQPLAFQVHTKGYRPWAKEKLRRIVPLKFLKIWRRHRTPVDWYRGSSIQPRFAERLNLLQQQLDDPTCYFRTPLDIRNCMLFPGRSLVGAIQAQAGAAYRFEFRDPTADPRVLAFTYSVPDEVYIDPGTGFDRWLIREAMRDRLPDEVRLNRIRGIQAGDLIPRLRASAGEVNTTLEELARGPAAEYVDVPYLREVWGMAQTQDTIEAFYKSGTVLTRGIMAGLWVNGFYNAS